MTNPSETMQRRAPEAVRPVIQRWLSERLGTSVDVVDVAAPGALGHSNDTFMVSVVADGVRQELVVQAAPIGPALFPVYDIPVMYRLQHDLGSRTDVRVPNVRWLETDQSVLGGQFYVMDRVDGQVPDATYHTAGWFADATSDQRLQVWRSALQTMATLHRIDLAGDGFDYLCDAYWGMPLDADPVEHRLQQWSAFVEWSSEDEPDDPPVLLREVWTHLRNKRPAATPPLGVHWGDAKMANLMVRDFDVAALLDWELCGVGPAEEDLANFLVVDWMIPAMMGSQRLADVPSREQTEQEYAELLGRDLVAPQWWFTFTLAKMAADIHRVLIRQRRSGLIPADLDLGQTNPALGLLAADLEAL